MKKKRKKKKRPPSLRRRLGWLIGFAFFSALVRLTEAARDSFEDRLFTEGE